jgi:hypothetical protein
MKTSSVAYHVTSEVQKFELHIQIYYIQIYLGDEVTTFEKLKEFQSVLPLSLTDPIVAQQKLQKLQVTVYNTQYR